MRIETAAARMRRGFKKLGIDPKGRVRVMNNSYISELTVDIRCLAERDLDHMMGLIYSIEDDGWFLWNIEG